METARRTYTLRARGEAMARTRADIERALVDLAGRRPLAAISLDDVAGSAGVSVQTVLRHFGSREGLLDATAESLREQVREERRAPAGDLVAAVSVLVDHYEKRGRMVLLLLSQEDADARVREIVTSGRRMHRAWVAEVFAPFGPDGATTDLLVVATDVYAWKLLRIDRALSRPQTEERLVSLVRAILEADR